MLQIRNPLGKKYGNLNLPDNSYIVKMNKEDVLNAPLDAINDALNHPIGSDSLFSIAKLRKSKKADANAVVVVSDNTRPVPYKGDNGILLPILNELSKAGYSADDITVLVATGMHRPMSEQELREMIDPEIYRRGIKIINHDAKKCLSYVGTTARGTRAMVDSLYVNADLKILTGLVESHFMAGASGGRKAICPGLVGEETTFIFHGPELMEDKRSRDLNLDGNPVHEESLAVAKLAGVDFILNVTLNHDFEITGVFAGDLVLAHEQAVEHVRKAASVKIPYQADIVITHGGYVGINHYQLAKSAVASLGALKENGYLITLADTIDSKEIIGSPNYRCTLALLHLIGSENFDNLLKSSDWKFLPEQWQVQQWAKVFKRIPESHYYLYSPQIKHDEYKMLVGNDISSLMKEKTYQESLDKALLDIQTKENSKIENLKIIFIEDGPYVVPSL